MTRKIIALIGLALLAGCSGGGGDSTTPSSAPAPLAQPDMLTATDQGLQRGKANGQEQRLILAQPNMHISSPTISQGHVFYGNAGDVWAVRTDGTGNRAVVNTPDREFIATTNGPWLIYGQYIAQPSGSLLTRYGSANIDTGARFQFDDPGSTGFMPQNDTRLISTNLELQISSITNSGTDRLTYDSRTPGGPLLATQQIVGQTLIYSRSGSSAPSTSYSRALAIPLSGGVATQLDEDQYDTYSVWSIGDRVIYHRCLNSSCDVASIRTNGASRVVLTTHPANEAVQGTVGNQVIIRRNLSGTDQLIAVPVTGGPERLLMTMTNDDMVILTTDLLAIVSRPTGIWTVDMGGTLNQISEIDTHFGAMIVGNALCFNHAVAAYCTPLDGSPPAVKIADTGNVIGAL